MYQKCRHIMPNGTRCHSPALKDTPFCYFHTRLHRTQKAQPLAAGEPLSLPALEDRSAIQIALAQVLAALGSENLDAKRAGLFLYGLQIASQNVDRDIDIIPITSVASMTHTSDGEELAPEKCVCEPPEDCDQCLKQSTCLHYRLELERQSELDELDELDE